MKTANAMIAAIAQQAAYFARMVAVVYVQVALQFILSYATNGAARVLAGKHSIIIFQGYAVKLLQCRAANAKLLLSSSLRRVPVIAYDLFGAVFAMPLSLIGSMTIHVKIVNGLVVFAVITDFVSSHVAVV